MWICKRCETYNEETGAFCYICRERRDAFPEEKKPPVITVSPQAEVEPPLQYGGVIAPAVPSYPDTETKVSADTGRVLPSEDDYADIEQIMSDVKDSETAKREKKGFLKWILIAANIAILAILAYVIFTMLL